MLHWLTSRGISTPLAIAIVVLGVIQLTLQIWGLVDVLRRPAPAQRKVAFLVVIVLGGLIGAIAYLAVGRPMLEAENRDAAAVSGDDAARRRALDQLYGSPPDQRK